MVLILLSSPNPSTPLWPQSPRSKDLSPFSPRTPLTPSPSFFAILSPIFTADDNVPQSPAPRQLSPGTIPPETPPPWLLGPQSPATPIRPVPMRQPSSQKELPSLPRLTTGEGLAQSPRHPQRQRPSMPSITHSYSGSSPQPFRPPPGTLKRMKTDSFSSTSPPSPLRQSWRSITAPIPATSLSSVPQLKVRPPSQGRTGADSSSEDDQLEDDEARRLSVAMMGVDSGLGCGFEGETKTEEDKAKALDSQSEPSSPVEVESMEIPIALEDPMTQSSTIVSALGNISRPLPSPLSKPIPRSIEDLRTEQPSSHSRSQSITISLKAPPKSRPLSTHISRPLQLTPSKSPRPSASVGNLRELNELAAKAHKHTPSSGLGPLGRLAVAVKVDHA